MRILVLLLLLLPLIPAQAQGGVTLFSEDFGSVPGYTFMDDSFLIPGPTGNVTLAATGGFLRVEALPFGSPRYLHLSPLVPSGRCTIALGLGLAPGSYPLFLMLLGPEDSVPGGWTYSYLGIYIYNSPENSTEAHFMVMDPSTGSWVYGGRMGAPYATEDGVPVRRLEIELDSSRSVVTVSSGSSFAIVPYVNGWMRLPGPGDIYAVLGADGGTYYFDFVLETAPPGDPITILPHIGRLGVAVVADDGSPRDAWGLGRLGVNFTLLVGLGSGSQSDLLAQYDPSLFMRFSPAYVDWATARSVIAEQVAEFSKRYGSPPGAVLFSGRSNISVSDFLWRNYGAVSLSQSARHWVFLCSQSLELVEALLRAGQVMNVYFWVPVNASDPAYDPAIRISWGEFESLRPLLMGDPALDVFMDDWSSCNGGVVVLGESPLSFMLLGPSAHFQILLPPGSEGGVLVSALGHFYPSRGRMFSVPRGSYVLDLAPPVVRILGPGGGPVNSSLVELDLYLWDDVGVRELEVLVDGETVLRSGAAERLYVPVPDGAHHLRVVAVDGAGRSSEDSVEVLVDRAPPVLGEVPTQVGSSYLNFTIEAVDPTGVDLVEWRVDGGQWCEGPHVHYGPLAEGQHFLEVRARDGAGNWAYRRYAIMVDVTGPEVRILYPGPGMEVGSPVTVVWEGDAVHYELYVDGRRVEAHHGAVLDLGPGQHELRLVGYDEVGNPSEAVVRFSVRGGPSPWPAVVAAAAVLALIGIKALRD